MIQNPYYQNICGFLKSLPSNKMSLVLFDRASQIVGFAVLDKTDKEFGAKIYNLECKKIKDVQSNVKIKEMVDTLIKERCTYMT